MRDGRLLRLRAVTHALRAPGAEPPAGVRSIDSWSRSIQKDIAAVTGDDAAMSMLGVGADLEEFQALFAPRIEELERQFIAPLDELGEAIARAERELRALQRRHVEKVAEVWGKYKPGYERYLHAESVTEDVDDEQQEVPGQRPAGDTSPSKVEEASL